MLHVHGQQHEHREKGVHGTDVVQHVLISQNDANSKSQKVQSEKHLQVASDGKALPLPIQEKVAITSHPNICSNVHSDGIVNLLLFKVVIP